MSTYDLSSSFKKGKLSIQGPQDGLIVNSKPEILIVKSGSERFSFSIYDPYI